MNLNPFVSESRSLPHFTTTSLTTLLSFAGLLALNTHNTWAEDPNAGFGNFRPGSRTFSNNMAGSPFANQAESPSGPNPGAAPPAPSKGRPWFDDEEDPEEDTSEDFGAGTPNLGRPGQYGDSDTGRGAGGPSGGVSSFSAGGTPPGGVIPAKKAPPTVDINTETGEGSKELITEFNFPDAPILEIAKTLGKLTGKNFILDNKDVSGRITIISNSPITVGDAWRAFLTALDMNGFALIPSGKYIRIARQRDARDKQLKTYTGSFSPDTDALITRVFTLKYIDAEEVARTFRNFMPANSRIIPYDQTNTVIVTDTGSNIAKLTQMLELLDVEGYDVGIEVLPVKYASAAEIAKLIDTLIPGTGGAGGPPGAPRFGGGGGSRFNARRTKEGGVINTIIADERTNTLIINANSKGFDQVRALVTKLDKSLPATAGGGRVHVVYLQFADAEQVANTLNNISSQMSSAAKPSTGSPGIGVNPVASSLFEGTIKVAADKATNSLVITASPTDFATIQRVVNRLDILRDEVFVEVVVMEVALTKRFDFSSNSVAPKAGGVGFLTNQDLLGFIQSPLSQTGAVIGYKDSSTTNFLVGGAQVPVPNFAGLIKAIQANAKTNILATPQIIALDNSEANFESSENLPVPTSTAVQGAGVTQSVTKERVALSIKIKPQINKMSNFVKLDITTKLGDISDRALPAEVRDKAYATLERTAQTTVVVGDSDTVVIGGLMRDKMNESISKIPILGDIPVIGWLFRAKTASSEKTNLLIFMTPHIIRQYEKIRAILDKKLKERDEFLETETGGEDPLRQKRDQIIRSLPNIEDITAKRKNAVSIDDEEDPLFSKNPAKKPSDNPPAKAVEPTTDVPPAKPVETAPAATSQGGTPNL